MKPLPETQAVLSEWARHGDPGWSADVNRLVSEISQLAPHALALAVTTFDDGLTYAFLAAGESPAWTDGDGSPTGRHETARVRDRVTTTLSLPVIRRGYFGSDVTVYTDRKAELVNAFPAVVRVVGARHGQAVWNADRDCALLEAAHHAPVRMIDGFNVDLAIAIIMTSHDFDHAQAQDHLEDLALAMHASLPEVARAVIALDTGPTGGAVRLEAHERLRA